MAAEFRKEGVWGRGGGTLLQIMHFAKMGVGATHSRAHDDEHTHSHAPTDMNPQGMPLSEFGVYWDQVVWPAYTVSTRVDVPRNAVVIPAALPAAAVLTAAIAALPVGSAGRRVGGGRGGSGRGGGGRGAGGGDMEGGRGKGGKGGRGGRRGAGRFADVVGSSGQTGSQWLQKDGSEPRRSERLANRDRAGPNIG